MNSFITFLEQNFLATVIVVTSFIADLFAIAKIFQKEGAKSLAPYVAAVLSVVCLISIGYLTIQYSVIESNNIDFNKNTNVNVSSSKESNTQIKNEPPDSSSKDDYTNISSSSNIGGDSSSNTGGDSSSNTGGDSSSNTGGDSSSNTGGDSSSSIEADNHMNLNLATLSGPYNSGSFTLEPRISAGKMTINGIVQLFGISQDTSDEFLIELVNYDTNQVFDSKYGFLGDTITFSNIPNGTYSYRIHCTGYQMTSSRYPFKLEQNDEQPKNSLTWFAVIESNNSKYSPSFRIQLQNEMGEALKYTSVEIGAVNVEKPYTNSYSPYQMTTNEQGYLTSWENVDGKDYYHIVDFQLADGYFFMVSTENGMSGTVDIQGNLGICVLPNQ